MKPVDQQVLSAENGDCFACCVASILELSRHDVPNFMDDGLHWFRAAWIWLNHQGLTLEVKRLEDGGALNHQAGGYWIASGNSPRGDHNHAVVFDGPALVHDPHPSRDGLDGPPLFAYRIVKKEPEIGLTPGVWDEEEG